MFLYTSRESYWSEIRWFVIEIHLHPFMLRSTLRVPCFTNASIPSTSGMQRESLFLGRALSAHSLCDWTHPLSRIGFGGLNLPSRPRIVPVPALPSSTRGFYAFNTAGFLWRKLGLFIARFALRPSSQSLLTSSWVFVVSLPIPTSRV